ncbi:hypothetical protein C8R45DRAFT_1089281 [Mycena sanguinolenta]|nr:hypothetical protein C8R45DRAFT_1089281 [Mycena sanguinolenta]
MSVLIDDNDPLIQYSPPSGWSTTGAPGPKLGNTTHASATPADTAALVFEGTSISIYGIVVPSSGQSRLNFSIDGVDAGFYEAPIVPAAIQNHLFWKSPVFSEAQHKLVVTLVQDLSLGTAVNQLNRTFFLDYFIYTTTITAGKTLFIDDADTSVTYSPGGWQSDNSTDSCLEGTQHTSQSVRSWAAASFSGTGISLFSPLGQKGFSASIVVDGSKPVISQSLIDGNKIFNTSGLSSGPHTINVTVLEGNLGIDYFFVSNASSLAPATTSQSQPVPSPSQPAPSPSQPVPSPSHSSGTPQSSKKPPIAAIVGGTIGGLIMMLLLALIIWKRRRNARHNNTQLGVSESAPWGESEMDHDGLLVTAPRPFQPSESANPPPPYTLKYLPVVRRWIAQ